VRNLVPLGGGGVMKKQFTRTSEELKIGEMTSNCGELLLDKKNGEKAIVMGYDMEKGVRAC